MPENASRSLFLSGIGISTACVIRAQYRTHALAITGAWIRSDFKAGRSIQLPFSLKVVNKWLRGVKKHPTFASQWRKGIRHTRSCVRVCVCVCERRGWAGQSNRPLALHVQYSPLWDLFHRHTSRFSSHVRSSMLESPFFMGYIIVAIIYHNKFLGTFKLSRVDERHSAAC